VSAHFTRRHLLQSAMAAALPLGLHGCSSGGGDANGEEPLVVGGLPVTCNLTLPVACVGKNRAIAAGPRSRNH
jgi:NitT/TauT family transport system substrate-binding protein